MSVTTMRIDDRLIHGQIVTRWIADAQADTILIADDMAAGDATQQMLLKLVAPANINLLIKTINEGLSKFFRGFRQKFGGQLWGREKIKAKN